MAHGSNGHLINYIFYFCYLLSAISHKPQPMRAERDGTEIKRIEKKIDTSLKKIWWSLLKFESLPEL
jgi:hypothetical protein